LADLSILRERMIDVARAQKTLTYTDLYGGDRWAARGHSRQDCGRVSITEHRAGRPLLSVVVVSMTTHVASHGLYVMARQHDAGVLTGDFACKCGKKMVLAGEDEPAFRARQLGLVYAEWSVGGKPIGTPYRSSAQPAMPRRSRALAKTDLDALDRATQAHREILDALASHVLSIGLIPLAPASDLPQFDLAWETPGARFVAEVKSLPAEGERQQLRLGLGQVLDYQDAMEKLGKPVVAVLAVEREPRDLAWLRICASHRVELVWPGRFEKLARPPAPGASH
jgi:hypothetical protein